MPSPRRSSMCRTARRSRWACGAGPMPRARNARTWATEGRMATRTAPIALLLCALAAPPAAAAAPPRDDYAATAYGGRTLSPTYHLCLAEGEGSNAEIGQCLEAEAERQDAALNAAYHR